MPWWWKHAAGAFSLFAIEAAITLWAQHDRFVLEVLAGLALAGVLLGGLWLIGLSADREMQRRRQPPRQD